MYEKNLYADANIAGEGKKEEGGCRWVVEGEMAGGLDIQRKVALATETHSTQRLGPFNCGKLAEENFFNL